MVQATAHYRGHLVKKIDTDSRPSLSSGKTKHVPLTCRTSTDQLTANKSRENTHRMTVNEIIIDYQLFDDKNVAQTRPETPNKSAFPPKRFIN